MTGAGRRLELEEPVPFAEAQALVRATVSPLPAEDVSLREAGGRVLAEAITAPHPVPPFDNSMVDGFAVVARDVREAGPENPVELPVDEDVPAGRGTQLALAPGRAMRIMTGAPLPDGADAVVMLEWTEWEGDRVRVERAVEPGQFVRRAGEDMEAGARVLEPGETLGPAALGVLASLGKARLAVHRRPTVSVLATGDELLRVEEELSPGKIRSSNDLTIAGQAREAGAEVVELGFARDDDEELAERIGRARDADVLVTSGGVSVGDRDRVQSVLENAGFERVLWRVATSPGKPLLFGRLGETLVFGLPGNPVSSMVSFENFVRPVLRMLQGDRRPDRPRLRGVVREAITGPAPRLHFARVRVAQGRQGISVHEVRPLGSGNLRSMMHANALAVLPEGVGRVEAGDVVDVVLTGDLLAEEE